MKKPVTRRATIKAGLTAGILLPFMGSGLLSCSSSDRESGSGKEHSNKKLKILILGGTSFLGPHQIAYALSRGHSVTTFTRGKTSPTVHSALFENVEQLIGDRADNLTALETGRWDVVIDNSGRNKEWTRKSAELLKDKSELYLYTSSTGVYYPYLGKDIAEDTPLVLAVPEGVDGYDKMEYDYGVMKAQSELETIKAFGKDRSIIVRPTYMIGLGDTTDRFIHWPVRLAKGGEVLVPGKIDDPVQYTDVRDVAEWMIRLAEDKLVGTYNAVGPAQEQTMMQFVKEAAKAFETKSTFIMVDDYEFLSKNEIHFLVPWIPTNGNNYGSSRASNKKALAAGLTFRAPETSVKDTHAWWYSDALTDERRAKFEADAKTVFANEKQILEKWKANRI